MFGLFSKKAKVEAVPALIEARSYYGIAYHIVETHGVDPTDSKVSPALCGYDDWLPTNSVIEVTAEKVEKSLPNQHSNWRWCTGCVEKILPNHQ